MQTPSMQPRQREMLAVAGAFLAGAWLIGVAVAALFDNDVAALTAVASLLAACIVAWRPRPSALALAAVGAVLVGLGGWRYEATQPTAEGTVAAFNDTEWEVHLRGVIDDEPDVRATGRLYRVDVQALEDQGHWVEAHGKVLLRLPPFPAYEYGDQLELEGELEAAPTFPDFDYRDYLLRQGVVSLMAYPDADRIGEGQGSWQTRTLISLRHDLTTRIDNALPEPQSSLAAGILLGTRANLSSDLQDAMRITGTSHLVAVSGQNVTLLAGLVIAAFAWLIGRRQAAFLSLGIIVSYAALVGAEASVIRASIMASIYVASVIAGRQNAALVGLALAAAGMTALDPQIVHDIGFQLSFAATIGLVTLGNELKLRAEEFAMRWPALADAPATRPLIETLTMSLAAILVTLPVTAVNFGQVSLVALPANLLAVPAFVAVALTAAIALAASLLPGGEALGWVAWLPATYMIAVIQVMASVPSASITFSGLGVWHGVAWYAVLGGVTLRLMRRPVSPPEQHPRRWATPVPRWATAAGAAAVVLAATVFVWVAVATSGGDDRLAVTFLDVGQGDAALIEGPYGHRILVDGGPSGDVLAEALGGTHPFYNRSIDLVVLTHPQTDHGGGLISLLDTYDIGAVLDSAVEDDGPFAEAWSEALSASGVRRYVAHRGMQVDLGAGARLEVIAPLASLSPWADPNDASTVLRVTMGQTSFLLTGDIEEEGEAALVQSGTDLSATVLKVAHHGSRTSTTEAFVARVTPAIRVISVGADNRFGHPAPEVLSRLGDGHLLRTDEHGDIRIETDGDHIWVTTDR